MKIIEANIYWTPTGNLGLLNDLHALLHFIHAIRQVSIFMDEEINI